jgi:TM2 domain-containing membrane protein YozV
MFCTNCGAEIDDKAVVCVKCGVATRNMHPGSIMQTGPANNAVGYDWLTVLLLCFFLGGLGVHNFYTKKTGVAIAQLLTLGGCGVWALVDFIMILTESYRDGNGNPLVRRL